MAQKKITELQLRDEVEADLNFASDDGVQSYRVTAAQIKTFMFSDEVVERVMILEEERIPVGTVFPFAGGSAPAGFLLCDGSSLLRSTYADLFGVLSTTFGAADGTHFNIPDTRGIFIKGAGTHGTLTTAPSGAFTGTRGTYENDQFQGHVHAWAGTGNNQTGTSNVAGGSNFQLFVGNNNFGTQTVLDAALTFGANGTPRTGTHTRPASVGLNYIIKY